MASRARVRCVLLIWHVSLQAHSRSWPCLRIGEMSKPVLAQACVVMGSLANGVPQCGAMRDLGGAEREEEVGITDSQGFVGQL